MYFNETYSVHHPKSCRSTCQATKRSFPLTATFQNLNKFLTLTNYTNSEKSSLKSDSSLDGWQTYSFYEPQNVIIHIYKLSQMDTKRKGTDPSLQAQASFITFIFMGPCIVTQI